MENKVLSKELIAAGLVYFTKHKNTKDYDIEGIKNVTGKIKNYIENNVEHLTPEMLRAYASEQVSLFNLDDHDSYKVGFLLGCTMKFIHDRTKLH